MFADLASNLKKMYSAIMFFLVDDDFFRNGRERPRKLRNTRWWCRKWKFYGGLKMTVSDWTRGHVIPLVREEERSAKDRPRLEKIQHFFFPGVGRIYQQFEG